jgi:cytochrome c-type biogenesis protein CcmH/NrfG
VQVLAFNAEIFPESSNAHDSLGEAHVAAGERDKAIESYRRAIELDPSNASSVKALEKLQASAP